MLQLDGVSNASRTNSLLHTRCHVVEEQARVACQVANVKLLPAAVSRLTELISHRIGIRVHFKEEEMTLEHVRELLQHVARCSSMRKQEVRESAVGLEACGWRELRQPWLESCGGSIRSGSCGPG